MFLNHFTIDDNINCQKKSGSLYQIRRMYPRDNHHYNKNIKLIGGVDLNPERFDSEYQKRYIKNWKDFEEKNQPYYQTALANKQHDLYMEMVHGVNKD